MQRAVSGQEDAVRKEAVLDISWHISPMRKGIYAQA
jgi:hypothetical protein